MTQPFDGDPRPRGRVVDVRPRCRRRARRPRRRRHQGRAAHRRPPARAAEHARPRRRSGGQPLRRDPEPRQAQHHPRPDQPDRATTSCWSSPPPPTCSSPATSPRSRKKLGIDLDDLRAANPSIIYAAGSGWGATGPDGRHRRLRPRLGVGVRVDGVQDDAAGPRADVPAGRVLRPPGLQHDRGRHRNRALPPRAHRRDDRDRRVAAQRRDVGAQSRHHGRPLRRDRSPTPTRSRPRRTRSSTRYLHRRRPVALPRLPPAGPLLGRALRPSRPPGPRRPTSASSDMATRAANSAACVARARRDLREPNRSASGRSASTASPASGRRRSSPAEVHDHVQVAANGYLPEVTSTDGSTFRLPAPPMQFGGQAPIPQGPAPELGQHTEELLLELGHDWDQIADLRASGALG